MVWVAALGLSAGVPVGYVGTAGLVGVLVGAGVFIGWLTTQQWGPNGATRHQARLVEAHMPGLRGRLMTVLDRGLDPSTTAWSSKSASSSLCSSAIIEVACSEQ